ncbi:MAG: alpha/beta hydrolase [Atopococcus tabaci]|uniref:Alpha/beta hydrolase n=1 Tax=Atopococcus tabaci TaxID=269774 RepID=A0AA43ZSP8_9LACT|nr:alpha/beta hydrolase [Atopococcus tabaci]
MKKVLTNGVTLHYEKMGEGPVLLLLHGNGESHRSFDKIAPALAEYFTVYGVDSRGQGASSHRGELVSYEQMAEDIDLFIQNLQLSDVSIMGHSDGAIVALMLAIQQKDYLSHLVLLGINLNTSDLTQETKDLINDLYEKSGHSPMVELMLHEPNIPHDDLLQVRVPALIVAGDNDIMDTDKYAEIARLLPCSQLYIVPGTNHMNFLIGTDRIAPEVIRFLTADAEEIEHQNQSGVFGQNLEKG